MTWPTVENGLGGMKSGTGDGTGVPDVCPGPNLECVDLAGWMYWGWCYWSRQAGQAGEGL